MLAIRFTPHFMVLCFGEFCLRPQNFSIMKALPMNQAKSNQLRKLINSQYFLVSFRKLVRLRITFKIKIWHILIMCVLEIYVHVGSHSRSHEQSLIFSKYILGNFLLPVEDWPKVKKTQTYNLY